MMAVTAIPRHHNAAADGSEAEASGHPFAVLTATADAVYAVVPTMDVSFHLADLPVRNEAQARRAAPFAIEDDIAVDPATVHVALGPQPDSGPRLLAVAAKDKMGQWTAALPPVENGSAYLVPESTALAAACDTAVIVDRGDFVIAALADGSGFAVETGLFQRIAGELFVERELSTLAVYSDRPDAVLPRALSPDCAVERKPALSEADYAGLLLAGAPQASLSLLQGPYAGRVSWRAPLRQWRSAIAAAAVLVLSYAVLLVSEGVYYARAADDFQAQTEAAARAALPDVNRIVNPRTQVLARLNGMGNDQGSAFLPLSSALFEGIANTSGSRIEGLLYDQTRGSLSATVSIGSYADMDTLRGALAQRGVTLEEGASRTSGTRIVSDITVGVR